MLKSVLVSMVVALAGFGAAVACESAEGLDPGHVSPSAAAQRSPASAPAGCVDEVDVTLAGVEEAVGVPAHAWTSEDGLESAEVIDFDAGRARCYRYRHWGRVYQYCPGPDGDDDDDDDEAFVGYDARQHGDGDHGWVRHGWLPDEYSYDIVRAYLWVIFKLAEETAELLGFLPDDD